MNQPFSYRNILQPLGKRKSGAVQSLWPDYVKCVIRPSDL